MRVGGEEVVVVVMVMVLNSSHVITDTHQLVPPFFDATVENVGTTFAPRTAVGSEAVVAGSTTSRGPGRAGRGRGVVVTTVVPPSIAAGRRRRRSPGVAAEETGRGDGRRCGADAVVAGGQVPGTTPTYVVDRGGVTFLRELSFEFFVETENGPLRGRVDVAGAPPTRHELPPGVGRRRLVVDEVEPRRRTAGVDPPGGGRGRSGHVARPPAARGKVM